MDKSGNAGHPTKRFDLIRKLIKRGEVKIKGGGASGKPVVAIFVNKVFDKSKTVNRSFGIAVNPGYNTIGFAVVEQGLKTYEKRWIIAGHIAEAEDILQG